MHQSTGLPGFTCVESLFRDEIVGPKPVNELRVREWFQHLANSLLADNNEVFAKSST